MSEGAVGTFVKRAPTAPDSYAAEAAGLTWLAAAGPSAAKVVVVREVSTRHLVLDRLSPTRATRATAYAFGAALAHTHSAGAAAFGQPPDGWDGGGYIGTQPLTLRPVDHWGSFYADQRLLPYAHNAYRRGNVSIETLRAVERVADRLHAGEFDDGRPPARIHGDLWSGNIVSTTDGVVLIDPAAHGGHGLTDLAMLHLFGAPELAAITAAYVAAADLQAGWQSLIGLHQLHPLLVHAVSHGPAYGHRAGQVAAGYA